MSSDAAIIEIEKQIKEHQNILDSLETQKKDIEARLPQVRLNLEALNRTLSILGGPEHDGPVEQKTIDTKASGPIISGSQTDIGRRVLLEHGKALPMPALFAKAVAIRSDLNQRSFASNVYRLNSEGKVFKVKDKKISLLEWGNRKLSTEEIKASAVSIQNTTL